MNLSAMVSRLYGTTKLLKERILLFYNPLLDNLHAAYICFICIRNDAFALSWQICLAFKPKF
jgi:hypothetical protein